MVLIYYLLLFHAYDGSTGVSVNRIHMSTICCCCIQCMCAFNYEQTTLTAFEFVKLDGMSGIRSQRIFVAAWLHRNKFCCACANTSCTSLIRKRIIIYIRFCESIEYVGHLWCDSLNWSMRTCAIFRAHFSLYSPFNNAQLYPGIYTAVRAIHTLPHKEID